MSILDYLFHAVIAIYATFGLVCLVLAVTGYDPFQIDL
mgnify:CR=1 FL=1